MGVRRFPPPAEYPRARFGGRVPRLPWCLPGLTVFGNGVYSQNVIQNGSVLQPVASHTVPGVGTFTNCIVVTGAATIAPAPDTGACFLTGHTLIVDGAEASLKPSAHAKGFFIHLTGDRIVVNGGVLHCDQLGKGGAVAGVQSPADLLPDWLLGKINSAQLAGASYQVKNPGAVGGASAAPAFAGTVGGTGAAGIGLQTGGGGGGGQGLNDTAHPSGAGGPGTPFCGGAGGGGNSSHYAGGSQAGSGDANGGGGAGGTNLSGNGVPGGGGSGDPAGAPGSPYGGYVAQYGGGVGGLLMSFVKGNIVIGPGSRVSADGGAGGDGSGGGGGGGGGGCVADFHRGTRTNNGTFRANGGVGGVSTIPSPGTSHAGGPGGAGGVVAMQI